MLRQNFVDAARQLRAYLSTLSGSVVARAEQDTAPMFEKSVSVLSDTDVARAFGLPPAPKKPWPMPADRADGDYLNGDGAFLIEEVTRALQPSNGLVDQQQFLSLQRAAGAGMRTIEHVLDGAYGDEAQLRALIGEAYAWATALRDVAANRPA